MIIDDAYSVEIEAKRFMSRIDDLLQKGRRKMSRKKGTVIFEASEMTSAVRRASMDLSRALIKLRKG